MGFNSVYRCLQELFPQVDTRLLRAVAIEHPKDADVAAEIILTEVIPSISKKLLPVTPPQDMSPRVLIKEDESEEEENWLGHRQLVEDADVASSSHSIPVKTIKAADSSCGPNLNLALNEFMLSNASDTISKKLLPATPTQDMSPGILINLEDETEDEGNMLQHHQLVEDADAVSSSSSCSIPVEIIKAADSSSGPDLNVALNESMLSNTNDINDGTHKFLGMNDINEPNVQNTEDNFTRGIANKICQEISNGFRHQASEHFDQGQLDVDVVDEKSVSNGICQEMETEQNHLREDVAFTSNNGNRNVNHLNEEWVDFVPTADDYDATICDTSQRLEKCETALIEVEDSEAQKDCHVEGHTPNANDNLQIEFNARPSIVGETSDVEDEIGGNKALSQYNQACRIDMLEETIDEAKTNKKTLFSSMESLINLMREVELQENAAEQANMEAASGGSGILVRVEEYKAMLVHAKEANDMHAGEIYGEKAILATELKELQSRLSSLSDERNKSLAILEEMRQVLESRLAAAEILRKASEHEKLEKEESARKALLEQEAMMEKVVQESVRLQQEAEENSKLREFLMDRGRVVDMLQGEISVICQDIRLLKEKFDANLPLSKSFTASQTSCILASSGSSYKTLASNAASEQGILKISPAASVDSLSSKGGQEEEISKVDHNALLDDGWDIFEKDAELGSGVL